MSIRLDPRRVGVLKQLAAEADTRPGDLVRIWIEERLDAERRGGTSPAAVGGGGGDITARLAALTARVSALEASSGASSGRTAAAPTSTPVSADAKKPTTNGEGPKRRARTKVTAKPTGERVALHDEIIAVIAERGPLPAAEIATLIAARARYAPPRSGKPLDAATVNARVSNPTYRGRFTRSEGRIGLTEG